MRGGRLLLRHVLQHLDLIARHARAKLGRSHRLRNHAHGILPERIFDHIQRPELERLRDELLAPDPHAEFRFHHQDFATLDGGPSLFERPSEIVRRSQQADVRTLM